MKQILSSLSCDRLYTVFFIAVVINLLPGTMGTRLAGGLAWLVAAAILAVQLVIRLRLPFHLRDAPKKFTPKQYIQCGCWGLLIIGAALSVLVNLYRLGTQTPVDIEYSWEIEQGRTDGAEIASIRDRELKEEVTVFRGKGLENWYRLTVPEKTGWRIHAGDIHTWRLKFSDPFRIVLRFDTSEGRRYLRYIPSDRHQSGRKRNRVVTYGLGENLADGKWHTVSRDFHADLNRLEPGLVVKDLKYIEIRGSGRISTRDFLSQRLAAGKKMAAVLMASATACYTFLFLTFFMCRMTGGIKGRYWALSLLAAVFLIPVWQLIDYESASDLLKYTVAAATLDKEMILSVFRNVTAFSPFAAVVAVYFWGKFLAARADRKPHYAEGVVAVLASFGALVAGSRTGILSFFLGVLVLFGYLPVNRRKLLVTLVVSAVIMLHVFGMFHPYLGKKMGKVFPYFFKIRQQQSVELTDFIPDLTAGYADKEVNRFTRIKEAFAMFRQHPLIGIGPGQYNMQNSDKWIHNVHNLPVNILCEGGLMVFVPLVCLFAFFVWEWRRSFMTAVIVAVFTVSLFENLFDHTLSWNLTCSWLFAREYNMMEN